jgi:Family of unknown function (DUF6231)
MGSRIQCSDDVDLAILVEEKAPQRILTLGPHATNRFAKYLQSHPQTSLTHIDDVNLLAAMDSGQRFDFSYIYGVLEKMPKAQAGLLLTQLRDRSQFLYAKVPLGKAWLKHASLWEKNDMRGLGFDLINLSAEQGKPVGLFCYDSSAYKSEAEWRNSKYWAEPE